MCTYATLRSLQLGEDHPIGACCNHVEKPRRILGPLHGAVLTEYIWTRAFDAHQFAPHGIMIDISHLIILTASLKILSWL